MTKAFRPIRYEAWPTRMFGAYTIWAIGDDGSRRQVDHGTPDYCNREASRRNALLRLEASERGNERRLRD